MRASTLSPALETGIPRPKVKRIEPRRTAPQVKVWPDPDLVAQAADLLRELSAATRRLTDALDVAGYPERERRAESALLSALASGLPPISLHELVEALADLATASGPASLFPDSFGTLSVPDEARELGYVLRPVATVANGQRPPRHAGSRVAASRLTFSITQEPVRLALTHTVAVLARLEELPLAPPELSVHRRPRVRRPEPTRGASTILLVMLVIAGACIVGIALLATGTLTFGPPVVPQ